MYVPDSPYDPAIKEYVLYKVFEDQKVFGENLISSWESARRVFSGDKEMYLESTLKHLIDLEALITPKYTVIQNLLMDYLMNGIPLWNQR